MKAAELLRDEGEARARPLSESLNLSPAALDVLRREAAGLGPLFDEWRAAQERERCNLLSMIGAMHGTQ